MASLAGVMGSLAVGQTFVSGLDTGVGNACDAGTGTQESLRVATGVFLVVQELAFGVDERPGLHELGQ